MSFNFIAGQPAVLTSATTVLSGSFTGDYDGDGGELSNVSHIGQANAAEYRIVFFNNSTTGLEGDERNIRGHGNFVFNPGSNVFTANSGMVHGRTSISSHYTAQISDYYIGCNHTASITITLPYAYQCSSGQTFTIKDESGGANTYNINVIRQGSDTIDGETNFTIESPYGAVNLYSNGSNEFFLF